MKKALIAIILNLAFSSFALTQIPVAVHIQILKAEDARRYDKTLEDLMGHTDERVKIRAILAAGRIGDEKAIPRLASLMENSTVKVREMTAFALGEIESVKAADAILKVLKNADAADARAETRAVASVHLRPETRVLTSVPNLTARLIEAAGKIVAANPKAEESKVLGEAILDTLEAEDNKGDKQDRNVVRLALTAALRARPEDADLVVMKFLTNLDPRVRADAANTLARLRTKAANPALRAMVMSDDDPIPRANAVRALGAAEDKEALNMLIDAAIEDEDSRVRVSAIRALGSLKDPYAVEKLLDRGEKLLAAAKKSKAANPVEISELLEIASVLGRLAENTIDSRTVRFLSDLRQTDKFRSPETEMALARVSPKTYLDRTTEFIATSKSTDWRAFSAMYQGLSVLAALEATETNKAIAREANFRLLKFTEGWFWSDEKQKSKGNYKLAIPDLLRALTARKSGNSSGILGPILDKEPDPIIRATAAELLSNQPKSKENIERLVTAFARALETDKNENDAQLAILDALYKLDKKESVGSLLRAVNAPDYLLRKKAFELLGDAELQKEIPEISSALKQARGNLMDEILPHDAEIIRLTSRSGTRLGQILNIDVDYRRAASRKNGSVKAVLTTTKGTFTIDLLPEDAPLTVDNFVKVAKSRYFNGIEVHRVVPNFVMQDGDPRGDGNGGPGWSIRCEVNMVPYDRGAVGMALSGKDTGGSQWFATHSPQPHLDGGYTVFGRVNETGMKVVDNIVRGDKIISVRIVEGISTPKTRRK